MSQTLELKAADGHVLEAYLAQPAAKFKGKPKAGLVILQAIFGVNAHLRSVVDGFAQEGYLTMAPALFDRVRKHVEYSDNDPIGGREGYAIAQALRLEDTLSDIEAAIAYLRHQGAQKIGIIGYCWGGRLAWLSNTRLRPDSTVCYYPAGIQQVITEKSTCPAIFHFGLLDTHIPQSTIEQVQQEYPGFSVFTYEAGHGFVCETRDSYNPEAAALARQRTLAHFEEYLVAAAH